jgi:hypothetical protein
MDRIVLDRKIDRIGKEVLIKGPPLEALCFQGGRVGSLITLTDSEGNDFRGRVTRLSREDGLSWCRGCSFPWGDKFVSKSVGRFRRNGRCEEVP